MGTINSAMALITGALDADQMALNVTSNNVANASNQSYTREVPNWSENQPIYLNGLAQGAGITVTGGVSQRDWPESMVRDPARAKIGGAARGGGA